MAGYSYGVQGGYYGTGVDLQPWIDKAMERLLSPNEFSRLDNSVTSAYGGYMGYLNAFAKAKKFKQQGVDAYQAVQAGTYEPFNQDVSYGQSTSTRGRIPAATRGGGTGIPSTTLHRDLAGNVTQEIAGGGVTRGMNGNVIPQTADQLTSQTAIDVAQTDATRNWNYRVPIAANKTDVLKASLEDAALQTGRTAMDRYRTSKEGQAQQRIDLATQSVAQRYQMTRDKLQNDQTMLRLRNDLSMERDVFKSKLASGSQDEKNQFAVLMKSAEFEHDFAIQGQRLQQAAQLAKDRFDNAKTVKEADQAFQLQQDLNARVAKLQYYSLNKDLTPDQAASVTRAAVNMQSKGPGSPTITGQPAQDNSIERFNSIQEALDAGHGSGDVITLWNPDKSTYGQFRIK